MTHIPLRHGKQGKFKLKLTTTKGFGVALLWSHLAAAWQAPVQASGCCPGGHRWPPALLHPPLCMGMHGLDGFKWGLTDRISNRMQNSICAPRNIHRLHFWTPCALSFVCRTGKMPSMPYGTCTTMKVTHSRGSSLVLRLSKSGGLRSSVRGQLSA